ncbi:MAG: preprotein translocase subunit SecG [Deltaproteobacteria bacterium]|nr:preprotein translocase subunit SecG [Deltaproteobacteria bacterium]
MTTFVIIIHIIVCVALILIVLLQSGKGANLGAAFGGSTQTIFGATGSVGVFEKVTTAVAIIFMVTSLSLTYISAERGGRSVMQAPVAQEASQQGAQETAPQEPSVPPAPEESQPALEQAEPESATPAVPVAGEGAGAE